MVRPGREAFFADKKGRPVACPVPRGPVADTHTHLTSLRHMDPALALARAALAGIDFLVTVVDPADDARDPAALLESLDSWQAGAREVLDGLGERDARVPRVRLLAGVHPHNARLYDDRARAALCALLSSPACCGVGEIGLDYHYDFSPRDVQMEVFREQLALARRLDAPLSLHVREAHDDAYRVMSGEGIPSAGAVMHCFDLGADEMARFVGLGCCLGLGGALTFASMEGLRAAVAGPECPLEALVTETDAPYLSPVPLRGTPCEPACTALTADFLARLRHEALGEDPALVYRSCHERALALFGSREGFAVPADLEGGRA